MISLDPLDGAGENDPRRNRKKVEKMDRLRG